MLSQNPPTSMRAVRGYESELFPRSAAFAAQSAHNLLRFFGDGAPYSIVELFRDRLH